MDPDPIRETILETVEACLDAQLRAVRKLRGLLHQILRRVHRHREQRI